MFKQVVVVRKDLKMSTGKIAAQASHASVGAYKKTKKSTIAKWEREGGKKIVVGASSEEELLELYEKAKKEKIPCFLVKDAGLTELKPGTVTVLGIGPDEEKRIDKVTGKLKTF